jgi:hypothetical protein
MPEGQDAYARKSSWGTLIKLYEYDIRQRSMVLRSDGLMGRLELMLPGLMLPVRIHECRKGFEGRSGSFANTLTGLEVRLRGQEGDKGNLEGGFPDSGSISIHGERIGVTIYAFRREKEKAYKQNEGVLFVVNGQTHAVFPDRFFQRRILSLGYLARSLLVVLDCTDLTDGTREDLFMNSRDRLADGELARQIEIELVEILRSNDALARLMNERRREELEAKLEQSKPVEDVLRSILTKSPALARLFLAGTHLHHPFAPMIVTIADAFKGALHPSYFRFRDHAAGKKLRRDCHIGQRIRLDFETDVANDYFRRATMPGQYSLVARVNDAIVNVTENLNLHDGLSHLNVKLPDGTKPGDRLELAVAVVDETLIDPFVNYAEIAIRPELPPRTGGDGSRESRNPKGGGARTEERPGGIELPDPHWVRKVEWDKYEMDGASAMRVISYRPSDDGGEMNSYDYFLNADNSFLLAEMKARPKVAELLRARFQYGMTLIAMAAVRESVERESRHDPGEEDEAARLWTAEELVTATSDALAPILLPTIEALGELDLEPVGGKGMSPTGAEDDELGFGEDLA